LPMRERSNRSSHPLAPGPVLVCVHASVSSLFHREPSHTSARVLDRPRTGASSPQNL
jgi:hypothetical protein